MRPSTTPCKIRAIHLGEAYLNLIRGDQPPLKAKFALLTEEGEACGFFEKQLDWSEEALEALRKFAEVLENDVMGVVFVQTEEPAMVITAATADSLPTDETPQF